MRRLFLIALFFGCLLWVSRADLVGAENTNKGVFSRTAQLFRAKKAKIPGNMRFSEYTGFRQILCAICAVNC
jgi:hypothetical protein